MRIIPCFLSLLAAPTALAQTQPAPAPQGARDVVRAADDAFGRRVGVEEVGLYSEGEVRGFDLQSAGNYRIEDHYFVRATGLPLTLQEGTAIRVGANGLRTDFAAPSGVVQFDLAKPESGARATIEGGWWGGQGWVLQTRFAAGTRDGSLGVAGGVQLNPAQDYTDGTGGDYVAASVVPRWSPLPGLRLTAMLSRTWFTRGGDTVFATADGLPPPEVQRDIERSQPWMEQRTLATQSGLIGDFDAGRGWRFGASAFVSDVDDQRTFFNQIRFPGGGAPAEELSQAFRGERFRSFSAEAIAAKSFATGALTHRVIAMARRRDSLARTAPGAVLPTVLFPDVDDPVVIARPAIAFDPRRKRDTVMQWAGGLGYRLSIGDAAELRVDAQRAEYIKSVTALDGSVTRETSRPWLYSGSLTGALTDRLTGFASYARGLEKQVSRPATPSTAARCSRRRSRARPSSASNMRFPAGPR